MRPSLAPIVVMVLAAGACGRLGFDTTTRSIDGSVDSPPDVGAGNDPLHRYRLAGTYADDFGGPALVPLGGTIDANGYAFGANQGLQLTGAMPASTYSVAIEFDFAALGGWQKILDFKELATDEGLYLRDLDLQFVIVSGMTFATSADLFAPGVLRRVVLTRDAAKVVQGYVATNPQISFTDDADVAVLAGTSASFFVDDNVTGSGEAGPGLVRSITIWDRALTPAEVAAL